MRRDPDDYPDFDTRAPLDSETWAGQSSNVHSGLYDFGTNDLYIRYKRDGVDAIYYYGNVPASAWNGLVEARSKGGYINANIAYAYRYELLSISSFPQQGRGVERPMAKQFLTAPMTSRETAAHPHINS